MKLKKNNDKLPVALSVLVDLVGDIATGSSILGVTLFSEKIKKYNKIANLAPVELSSNNCAYHPYQLNYIN